MGIASQRFQAGDALLTHNHAALTMRLANGNDLVKELIMA